MNPTSTDYTHPDFSKDHVILCNSSGYRLGDSVAALNMMKWIDRNFGKKTYYLEQSRERLSFIYQMGLDTCTVEELPAVKPISELPDNADATRYNDDGHLWIWNDVLWRQGIRSHFALPQECNRSYRVVFAPLLEADYSQERCLRQSFVLDLCQELKRRFGNEAIILRPDRESYYVWEGFHGIGRQDITTMKAPLDEAVRVIASCELFIGCDTGLSHIAGCFPTVKQIALHDRGNLETHLEQGTHDGKGHMRKHEEAVHAITNSWGKYRSFPNKSIDNLACILFDHGGMAGDALRKTIRAMNSLL